MCIVGCLGMFMIQMKLIPFSSQKQRDAFDETFMPGLILLLKMGIIIGYITTTQVSYTDDRIFPSHRRNTSNGSCGMVARSVTIMAPIVNEWAAPLPILVILIFSLIGIATSLTFPTEQEQLKKQLINQNESQQESQSILSYHNISQELKNKEREEDEKVTY